MALVEVCPKPSQARVTPMKSTTTHIFLTKSEEIEASREEQTTLSCATAYIYKTGQYSREPGMVHAQFTIRIRLQLFLFLNIANLPPFLLLNYHGRWFSWLLSIDLDDSGQDMTICRPGWERSCADRALKLEPIAGQLKLSQCCAKVPQRFQQPAPFYRFL